MEDKSSLKEYSTDNNEPSQSLIEKIFSIIRSNWLAFLCALFISIITIIVVPIVYSIKEKAQPKNLTNLSWNIDGKTIVNQTNILDNIGNHSLGRISSIFIDNENNLYIVDKTKHRISSYQLDQKIFQLLFGNENGLNGNDSISFNSPNDIYMNSKSKIYIVDTNNHRIQYFENLKKEGSTIIGTGESGSNLNELNNPMSLTMDQNGSLYIADYGNNRILFFDFNTNKSTVIIGPYLNGQRNQFILTPISIQYSSSLNSLVIAQELGFNVVRWKLTDDHWTLIAGSASSELNGTSRTLFNRLTFANIDTFDNTYVVDTENQRIQFYKGDLTKGRTIAGVVQAIGNNSYIFNQPTAITLDSNKNLYVADSNNFRIQKFIQTF